jgi:hypothetical protein
MRPLKTLALCLVGTLPFIHCSNKPKFEQVKNDIFGELQKKKIKLAEKGILAEVAIGESRNLQTGIDKTELEARAKISRALESKTSSLQKKFQEEVGREFSDHFSQTAKTISDEMLRGTSLQETRFEQNGEGLYRVYGLMILDSDLYMKSLAGELEADKANRDRWRASKAYKELNDEVTAYQAWKKQESAGPGQQGL